MELVSNPFAQYEDRQEDSIPTATRMIYEHIATYLERRKDTYINRASSASMCVRRRWYQGKGYDATPLTPRKQVNFLLGDLTERVLLYFIKSSLVGDGKLYSEVNFGKLIGSINFQGKPLELYEQETMGFSLPNGARVSGRADGFGKRNSDGKWELIEIKSAADYGFDQFVDEGPGDYLKQSHALMLTDECKALDIKQVRFFYLRKNTGNLWDRLHDFDEVTANLVVQEYMLAMHEEAPPRPYGLIEETYYKKPTGRMTVPWQCGYCSFTEACQGKFTKEFKNGKPKLIFEVKQ